MSATTLITTDSPIITELLRGDGANGGLSVTYGTDDTGRELVRVEDGQTRWIGDAVEWRLAIEGLAGRSLDDWEAYTEACQDTAEIVNIFGASGRSSIEGVAHAASAGLLDGREAITILGRDAHIGDMTEEQGDEAAAEIDAEHDARTRAEIVLGLRRFTA